MEICQQDVLDYIAFADDLQIDSVIRAIMVRYRADFPDWEIMCLSFRKGEHRTEDLDSLIAFLRTCY